MMTEEGEEFMDINSNKPYQQPISSTGSLEQRGGGQEEIADTMTTIPAKTAPAVVASVEESRHERDHIFLEFTRSICPDCREVIDAHVFSRDGKVFMKKRCKNHGLFESLISSDVERYTNAYKFNRQGMMPLKFGTDVKEGCPYDCGLCPDHEQHSCVGVIEITNACNLRCPTCFATAEGHDFLSLDEVGYMLDEFIHYEGGSPEVIQFSGGEPTIHPNILEMINLATQKKIKFVMLNTNGVKISMDESFVKELAKLDPVVYLQFDGFRKETHERLRGKDLTEIKLRAIENLENYGIRIVLVSTIQRNVNEDEIGSLADFALSKKSIKGIVFQPTFYSGRHPDVDPLNVVTLPEVIKCIAKNSKHNLKDSDFVPTPCCYPTCNSSCYLYIDDDAEIDVKPLARLVNIEDYIDYFMNRSVGDLGQIRESIKVLNSFGCCSGGPEDGLDCSSSNRSNNYDGRGTSTNCCTIPLDLKGIEKNIKVIMVQSFMDPYNFDIKRLMKCCIHEITPQGKIVPICAFNNIPVYREDVSAYYYTRRAESKKTTYNIR